MKIITVIILLSTTWYVDAGKNIGCQVQIDLSCLLAIEGNGAFDEDVFFNNGGFRKVYNIRMRNMSTKFLPKMFEAYPVMTELVIENCTAIEIMEHTFKNARKLDRLIMSGNHYQVVKNYSFLDAHVLNSLKLEYNGIEKLEDHSLEGLTNLKSLSLSNNRISTISGKVFHSISNLEKLFINNNQLVILEANFFARNLNLKLISMNHNKLTRIDENLFLKLTKLNTLELEGNICVDAKFNQNNGLTTQFNQISNMYSSIFVVRLGGWIYNCTDEGPRNIKDTKISIETLYFAILVTLAIFSTFVYLIVLGISKFCQNQRSVDALATDDQLCQHRKIERVRVMF